MIIPHEETWDRSDPVNSEISEDLRYVGRDSETKKRSAGTDRWITR
jgi:hypothetical protein